MNFEPVRTLADLDTLDFDDILEGYRSAERGDPEPGPNRGRAFWHGWCNRMRDIGALADDGSALQLAREVVASKRAPWHTLSPKSTKRTTEK